MKKSSIVFLVIVGCLFFYTFDRGTEMYFDSSAETALDKLTDVSDNITKAFEPPYYIAFDKNSLIGGGVAVFGFFLFVIYQVFNKKNYLQGQEHGSAKWGTPADIAKYKDSNYQNNVLLTMTERLSLNTRKTMRNLNVLIIGGSGSGKTRFYLKPNLMQMHTSYVITDPKGTVLLEVGKMLEDNGYKIKIFNTVDFDKSMHYNPFGFIQDEKDILVFVDLFMTSTSKKGQTAADPFWENAEKMLYLALIGYMFYELPKEEQNFATLTTMINSMEVREEDETFMNEIDYRFEELEIGTVAYLEKYGFSIDEYKENCIKSGIEPSIFPPQPDHFAVSQYKKFKLAAGKTAKSILISCGVRLSPFDVKQVRDMTMFDEMELGTLGDEKQALFIIIDDKMPTFNFLAAIMYSQLFKELCDKADNKYKGRLPIHVRCLLDEFANIGQIPNFDKLIATIRSREISVNVIVQNMAQIESIYDKNAGTIVGNCDTTLFLGSGEEKTMKSISDRIGKTTIDHRGSSETKGAQGSYSLQDQILGRELITADEVGRLDNSECILFIRGLRPFKSKKFDIKAHPNFKKSADYNDKNYFDINLYKAKLEQRRKEASEENNKDDFEEFFNHLLSDDEAKEFDVLFAEQ